MTTHFPAFIQEPHLKKWRVLANFMDPSIISEMMQNIFVNRSLNLPIPPPAPPHPRWGCHSHSEYHIFNPFCNSI